MANFDTRAEAIEDAIWDSEDGDQVFIHSEDCRAFDEPKNCTCDPLVITVDGLRSTLSGT